LKKGAGKAMRYYTDISNADLANHFVVKAVLDKLGLKVVPWKDSDGLLINTSDIIDLFAHLVVEAKSYKPNIACYLSVRNLSTDRKWGSLRHHDGIDIDHDPFKGEIVASIVIPAEMVITVQHVGRTNDTQADMYLLSAKTS